MVDVDSSLDVTKTNYSSGTTRVTFPDASRDDEPSEKRGARASHEDFPTSYGVVYANDIARLSLLGQQKPQFSVGSVIVREKLAQVDALTPELIVVMVKRERGFNKKANDWEFLMIDGGLKSVTHREKTGDCRNCHKLQKDNDFVFRTYLSEETRSSQK